MRNGETSKVLSGSLAFLAGFHTTACSDRKLRAMTTRDDDARFYRHILTAREVSTGQRGIDGVTGMNALPRPRPSESRRFDDCTLRGSEGWRSSHPSRERGASAGHSLGASSSWLA